MRIDMETQIRRLVLGCIALEQRAPGATDSDYAVAVAGRVRQVLAAAGYTMLTVHPLSMELVVLETDTGYDIAVPLGGG